MFERGPWLLILGIAAVTVMTLTACRSVPKEEPAARVTSLTIFPVTAMGQPQRNFGEALGLLLEKRGFAGVRIAESAFTPEPGADFDAIAESFGSFVSANPVTTDFALYCEFQGSPRDGVESVREVLVDRTGKVIWVDIQGASDRDFARIKPSNPMSCCELVSKRLEPMLVLEPDGVKNGAMEQLWERKSGTPDRAERAAMAGRLEKLRAADDATLLVYPVRVGDGTDRAGGEKLVALLNDAKLCRARLAPEPLWFEVAHDSNEQRVLWDMAKAFRDHVRKHPPATDYAAYGDYIMHDGKAWAVHVVICDAEGELVLVDFQNDHHDDFQAIAPKNPDDCSRLAAKRLAGYLK